MSPQIPPTTMQKPIIPIIEKWSPVLFLVALSKALAMPDSISKIVTYRLYRCTDINRKTGRGEVQILKKMLSAVIPSFWESMSRIDWFIVKKKSDRVVLHAVRLNGFRF